MLRASATAGRYLLWTVLICGVGLVAYRYRSSLPQLSSIFTPQISEHALPLNPFWKRPATAPNGSPWPKTSEYLAGYPRLNVFGLASVTADNSGGQGDLFIKLIDRDRKPMTAVRVLFVKRKDKLVLDRVKPGHYDLRYLNLDTGQIYRSVAFRVTVEETPGGEQYRGWVIGLYGRIDGNSHRDEITEREFSP